jgi:hypothetical protein
MCAWWIILFLAAFVLILPFSNSLLSGVCLNNAAAGESLSPSTYPAQVRTDKSRPDNHLKGTS